MGESKFDGFRENLDSFFRSFIPSWDSLDTFRSIVGVRTLYLSFIVPFIVSGISATKSVNANSADFRILISVAVFYITDRFFSALKPANLLHVKERSFEQFRKRGEALEGLLKAISSIDSQYRDFVRQEHESRLSDLPQDEESYGKLIKDIENNRIRMSPRDLINDYYQQLSVAAQKNLNKSKPVARLLITILYILSLISILYVFVSDIDRLLVNIVSSAS